MLCRIGFGNLLKDNRIVEGPQYIIKAFGLQGSMIALRVQRTRALVT